MKLGWLNFDLDISTFFEELPSLFLNSSQPRQKWAERRKPKTQPCLTHPVNIFQFPCENPHSLQVVPEEHDIVVDDDGVVVLAANVAADVVALRQAGHVALAPRVEEQEKLQELMGLLSCPNKLLKVD